MGLQSLYVELDKKIEERRELKQELQKAKNTKELDELGERGKKIAEKIEQIRENIDKERDKELREMESLIKQKDKKNGIDTMGELRMLTNDNISNLYKNDNELDLGKYVRGALTGNWDNADAEQREYRTLSTTTGQVLIPKSLSASILKQVMNKSLIYGSGVPVVEMPNGNLTIAKIKNNPVYGFKEELATVTPQDATFEGVNLKGKMVYGLMKISIEALESSANLESVLKQAMGDAIADAIDKSILYGLGDKEIKGLFNTTGINEITATTTDYKEFVNAVGKIRTKNGNPTVMGINADTDTKLNLLTDTTGQPLNSPKVIDGLNRIVSNQLASDEINGSDGIVYDPNALIIGQQVQFKFAVSESLGFDDGSVYLRVYSLLDMAAVRPEYITRIKGLK